MDQRQILLGIIKNNHKTMYKEFLEFCVKNGVDENVRYLTALSAVKGQIKRPALSGASQGIYATFIKEDAFWQVNLPHGVRKDIEDMVKKELEPDFGPAEEEIINLIVMNNIVKKWIESRRVQ